MASGVWAPRTIKRFIESIGTSTNVAHVETDQGEGYLKALGNPEGPHVLACELVGTLLAEWLGLSTLDNAIVRVSEDDEIPFAKGGRALPGPAFITRRELGFSWGGDEATLHKLTNPEDVAKMVVLDTWIRNCDRYRPGPKPRINRDNVFLAWEAGQLRGLALKAIDHTHAFTCGRSLTSRLHAIDDVRDETVFGRFPEFFPFLQPRAIEAAAERLGHMSQHDAAEFVARVPDEWEVAEPIRLAWTNLISDRAQFVATGIATWM